MMGNGGATVDLVLEREEYVLGEELKGDLIIQGGSVAQQINQIKINLMITVEDQKKYTDALEEISYPESFVIHPNEKKVLPFRCYIPYQYPLSNKHTSYTFVTNLDVDWAVDDSDRDHILVKAPPRLQRIFDSLSELGFVEKENSGLMNLYAQEFRFASPEFLQAELDELILVPIVAKEGIYLYLDLELSPLFDVKVISRGVWLSNRLLDDGARLIKSLENIVGKMLESPEDYPSSNGFTFSSDREIAVGSLSAGIVHKKE
jgi:sporulation-control protein